MRKKADIEAELLKAFPQLGPGRESEIWLAPCVDAAFFLGGKETKRARLEALSDLNGAMRSRYGVQADIMRATFRRHCQEWENAQDEGQKRPPPRMPGDTFGALHQALTNIEFLAGFGGVDILLGYQEEGAFLGRMAREMPRPNRDPLFQGSEHGEDTHRMQWAMLWFKKILNPHNVTTAQLVRFVTTRVPSEDGTDQLSAPWHLIFDRDPRVPPFDEGDCRNPEKMTRFIVNNSHEFPLLSWYVKAKLVTHRTPDDELAREYITMLLCPDGEPTPQQSDLIDSYMQARDEEVGRIRIEDLPPRGRRS